MPNGEHRLGCGPQWDPGRGLVRFRVFSARAARIELCLYAAPEGVDEVERRTLERHADGTWWVELRVEDLPGGAGASAAYYGLRAWGPNWPFDPAWHKGSTAGFRSDVDDEGNRFNPNKLLLDPWALEISHDPKPCFSQSDPNEFVDAYYSGESSRSVDTGKIAPKSVLPLVPLDEPTGNNPVRPLRDDIIYEVHVRGLTRLDPSVPAELRGTFRAAGMKAAYLKELGVTAIELLPVFHFASEQNDDGDPRGDNYWGYMTLGYFAPNRRYAADKSPGGPTREFKAMIRAFHDAGLKVLLDVVYNHTGEGLLRRKPHVSDVRDEDEGHDPSRACVLSLRGLDNATFYELRSRPDLDGWLRNQRYQDNSWCGANLNVTEPAVREFILDSLHYWAREMGVDGFRFDLAPILGNRISEGGFAFDGSDPDSLLNEIRRRLPARTARTPNGVDLIAEPWALGSPGAYQLGHFPEGWAEWNDVYRNTLREAENRLWICDVPPSRLANAISGSEQQFRGRVPPGSARPHDSVNFIACHDGFTLRDLFATSGGDRGWDHGGDPARQRKAVRNAFALLMTSAGVPMFLGGDELLRSQNGRENAWAIDDESAYLRWDRVDAYLRAVERGDTVTVEKLSRCDDVRMVQFVRWLTSFRRNHACLRPDAYFTGRFVSDSGLKDITWYATDGSELREGWDDPSLHFVGFRLDSAGERAETGVRSIYVAYNWHDRFVDIVLPRNLSGAAWFRVMDTASWLEPGFNIDTAKTPIARCYGMHERSVAIFLER